MTIRKGEDWGRTVPRPEGLRSVADDRELALALADGTGRPTTAIAGDLARTLGARSPEQSETINELPIDLLYVRLDNDEEIVAVAHVVVRNPGTRGSWWRGEVLFVMNAQFFGAWNLTPRGHPNDGRAELLRVDPSLSARQRFEAARRAPAAAHLPHPGLSITRVRTSDLAFGTPRTVIVDGEAVGSARALRVETRPDAAVVYF